MTCLLVTTNAVKIMKTGKEVWELGPDLHPLGLSVLFCKMGMFLGTLQGLSPVPRTLHLVCASCPDYLSTSLLHRLGCVLCKRAQLGMYK